MWEGPRVGQGRSSSFVGCPLLKHKVAGTSRDLSRVWLRSQPLLPLTPFNMLKLHLTSSR